MKIDNQRYTIWGISLFLFLLLVLIIILFRMYDYIAKTNNILKEKQEVLNENNLSLAEINNQKDNLFSIVAHDVRSPIAAILSSTNFLKSNYQRFTADELEVLTGELERQTLTLYELIESVLVWAKSQMNGFNFKCEEVNISEVVNLLLDVERYSIDSKDIEATASVLGDESVKTDQQVVQVILRNFLSNAIKFTPIGGKITFTSHSNPSEYQISVIDNGIGISPEQLKKVLTGKERFSLKGTLNEPGNGIGLILCQEIAKKIGGHIHAESAVGKGSTFTLILPRFDDIEHTSE